MDRRHKRWTSLLEIDLKVIGFPIWADYFKYKAVPQEYPDEKTLQYLAGFKRYSTERVMKSLVGELTENEKWSVKGSLMGECWYKDCCISEHPDNLRCGEPEIEDGSEKMRMLIQSESVQKVLNQI